MYKNIPELQDIGVSNNGLSCPLRELVGVILHFSGNNSTSGRRKLLSPVKRTTASLCSWVKLVQCSDSDSLVLAVDGVLSDSINLSADNNVEWLLVVEGEVETSVLVCLGRWWISLLRGVVEWVSVCHLDLGAFVLDDGLVGKVVVDIGGLLGESGWLVDGVLGSLRSVHWRIGSVLVDGDHVEGRVVALVKEDFVALLDNDNIPRVDGAWRTHDGGEDAVGSEDGSLILLSELLNDWILGGCDVVRSALNNSKPLLLSALNSRLVVVSVVVVQESVCVDVLALIGVKVELGQAVKINLLQQPPVRLDVNRCITVALWLVVVLPSETAPTTSSSTASAGVV